MQVYIRNTITGHYLGKDCESWPDNWAQGFDFKSSVHAIDLYFERRLKDCEVILVVGGEVSLVFPLTQTLPTTTT